MCICWFYYLSLQVVFAYVNFISGLHLQTFASKTLNLLAACAKLEVGISPHSLCGSLSVNVYLQCVSHLTMEAKVQQRVYIDFCFRLGKTGAETYELLQAAFRESCQSRSKILSGIPVSKVDADPLKTTPAQAGRPPPIPRRPWHMCEKSFALTNI